MSEHDKKFIRSMKTIAIEVNTDEIQLEGHVEKQNEILSLPTK